MEQLIKLTGRIAKVLPLQSGVSARTGNPWQSQEYILEYFTWSGSMYPDKVVFKVFGEDKIKQFALKELEENIIVFLRFTVREHDGRFYNEVNCYNVMRNLQNLEQTRPTEAPATSTSTSQPKTEGDADDLPF